MVRTPSRASATPRLLVDLAAGRLSDDELEALIPMLLADSPAAPEEVVRAALAVATPRCALLRTA